MKHECVTSQRNNESKNYKRTLLQNILTCEQEEKHINLQLKTRKYITTTNKLYKHKYKVDQIKNES